MTNIMGNNPERKLNSCPKCSSEKPFHLIEGGLNKCQECGGIFKFEGGEWKEVQDNLR